HHHEGDGHGDPPQGVDLDVADREHAHLPPPGPAAAVARMAAPPASIPLTVLSRSTPTATVVWTAASGAVFSRIRTAVTMMVSAYSSMMSALLVMPQRSQTTTMTAITALRTHATHTPKTVVSLSSASTRHLLRIPGSCGH